MKRLFGEDKFEASKLKSHLKMAQTRISLLKNKKRNAIKLQQRQIADLLRQGKDESARIKVENVIREDFMIEALDILELFCDLIQTRIQLIAESRTCPSDLKEAISSVLYAAPRVEIAEFMVIRDQFAKKFGKEFVLSAMENRDFAVNQRIMIKLSVKVPEPYLCVHYLKDIAEEHGIKLDDDSYQNDIGPPPPQYGGDMGGMNGGGLGGGSGGGMGYIEPPLQPSLQMGHQAMSSQQFHQPSLSQPPIQPMSAQYPPPSDFNQGPPPTIHDLTHSGYNVDFTPGHRIVPQTTTLPHLDDNHRSNNYDLGGSSTTVEEPPAYDFDDLQKRFEALKRRE